MTPSSATVSPPPRATVGDLRAVTVADAMHTGVVACARTTGVAELARMLAGCRVHCVAVMDIASGSSDEHRIWGIVSDLDVLRAATAGEPEQTAQALAHDPVITIRSASTVHDAAAAMVRYGVHHLVVVEPDRHEPVGIISTLDVAEVLARHTGDGSA